MSTDRLLVLTKETPIYGAPRDQRPLHTLKPGTRIRVHEAQVGKRTQIEYGHAQAAWADLQGQGVARG